MTIQSFDFRTMVTWTGIQYEVNSKVPWAILKSLLPLKLREICSRNQAGARVILDDVSGSLSSGQIVALMGPSGCGKSTLMKALFHAIRIGERRHLAGGSFSIFTSDGGLNKKPKVALVPQNDAFYEQFTVQETLMFVSRLSNSDYSDIQHGGEVCKVLHQLGLTHVRDLKVRMKGGLHYNL